MADITIPYNVTDKTAYTLDAGSGKKSIKTNVSGNSDCCCGCHVASSCPDPYISCTCVDNNGHTGVGGSPESFQTIRVVLSGLANACNNDYRSRGSIFWQDTYQKIDDPNITFDLTIRDSGTGTCTFDACGWYFEDTSGTLITVTNHAMDGYGVVGTCTNADPYPGQSCVNVISVVARLCYINSGFEAGNWILTVFYQCEEESEDDPTSFPGCNPGYPIFFGRFKDENICCGKPFTMPNEAQYDNGYEPGVFGFPVHNAVDMGGTATLTFCPS